MAANRKLKEKSVAELMSEIERRTAAASKAKAQGDEPLAIEIVQSILKLRDKVEADQALFDQYKATEERMDAQSDSPKTRSRRCSASWTAPRPTRR